MKVKTFEDMTIYELKDRRDAELKILAKFPDSVYAAMNLYEYNKAIYDRKYKNV